MNGTVAAVFVGTWVGVGLLTGLWLARNGHAPLWTLVAVILGPLFVPVALERAERQPRLAAYGPGGAPPTRSAEQHGLRVLVGLDGSPESREALDAALTVFGDRCDTLVLAEVVCYDSTDEDDQALDVARRRLRSAASGIGDLPVSVEVLAGPPADTLRQFAREQDIDLLVVGRRGHGLSTRLLGSVSDSLVRKAEVPVLIPGLVHRDCLVRSRVRGAAPG